MSAICVCVFNPQPFSASFLWQTHTYSCLYYMRCNKHCDIVPVVFVAAQSKHVLFKKQSRSLELFAPLTSAPKGSDRINSYNLC